MEPLNDLPGGVWTLATAFLTAVATVTVAIAPKWLEARDRIRERHSDATALLAEWLELPYRIARRTSDDPDTLAELGKFGHELQQRTAKVQAEMAADHRHLGAAYTRTLEELRKGAGKSASDAWRKPPVSVAADMNVGALVKDQASLQGLISAWACVGTYRLWPYRLLFRLPDSLRSAGDWNRFARLSSLLDELEKERSSKDTDA